MSEKDLVMQKEKEQNDLIDEWMKRVSEFKVDILEIWKQIRQYRQEIFEVKMKIKDLNNAYEKMNLKNVELSTRWMDKWEYRTSTGRNTSPKIDYGKADCYTTVMEILTYYGKILEHFRQCLIEEKMSEKEEKKEDEEFMLE